MKKTGDKTFTIEIQNLEKFAQNSARELKREGRVPAKKAAKEATRAFISVKECFRASEAYIKAFAKIPAEIEWLTDNYYMAERELREVTETLRGAEKLPAASVNGKPFIFEMAKAYLPAVSCKVTAENITKFLNGLISAEDMLEKELYLFVPAIKLAVLLQLSDVCVELNGHLKKDRADSAKSLFSLEDRIAGASASGMAISDELISSRNEARQVHNALAGRMAELFGALRFLGAADFSELLEEINPVEGILREDPAGVYHKMSEKSRAYYRMKLSRAARRAGVSEVRAAKRAVALSGQSANERQRHVGYFILNMPLGFEDADARGSLYMGAVTIAAVVTALFFCVLCESIYFFPLFLFPAFELSKNITDSLVARHVIPAHIPRIEFSNGVPEEGKTLCVISVLLTKKEDCAGVCGRLREYSVTNRDCGKNLIFGVLADLKDSKTENKEEDAEIFAAAAEEVRRLNESNDSSFFLFARKRSCNSKDGVYMGYERKRGAICEMVRLIKTGESGKGLKVLAGDRQLLSGVKYVITLDSDTRLTISAAKELIGAMMHPLNKPVVHHKRNVVCEGYGLLQPRVAVEIGAAGRSIFTRLFAGLGGVDPYGGAMSDIYQDLFSEGIFTGKGIFDVDVFYKLVCDRFPENLILSHDLLEGCHVRAGLISDVELLDGFPFKVSAYYSRLHRWTRGDFQIAPWLFGRVPKHGGKSEKNPLSIISRWKIFDNLRRSMTPAAILFCLVLGIFLRTPAAGYSLMLFFLSYGSALMIDFLLFLRKGGIELSQKYHSNVTPGLKGSFFRTLISLMFLPYHAYISLSAAATALYRMLISKKRLLSWITAAEAEQKGKDKIADYYKKMWISPALGVLAYVGGGGPISASAGILWAAAPLVAALLSRRIEKKTSVKDAERGFLKREGAFIWQYFEDFVTAKDRFLPPDNYQEQPATGLARRTSPTNIGLYLVSVLAALDLKLIDEKKAVRKLEATVSSVLKLEKWKGHLLNWYDTKTGRPLYPKSVSSVDSGNFAAALYTLRSGLKEIGGTESLLCEIDRLLADMDFSLLYDRKRRLFHINYLIGEDRPSESVYDLMASEARILSYIAIARGDINKKHWARLGRALVEKDGYRGMVSWTGTMFEYLMPPLFMPSPENSLLSESEKFAVYCQKKYARLKKIPFGMSESAFYAFDGASNYQYKAHGVQKLGLRRALDKETVISPYSSFLALTADLPASIDNLKALRQAGIEGQYGFYEACDYTAERLDADRGFMPVRCYMAHHLGMSLVAIDNVLCGNIMQKRFMADVQMGAYAELLAERIPANAQVMRLPVKDVPDKPREVRYNSFLRQSDLSSDGAGFSPNLHSNGSYTLTITDAGLSFSESMGKAMYRSDSSNGFAGMSFFVKAEGRVRSLYPAPFYDHVASYKAEFTGRSTVVKSSFQGLKLSVSASVLSGENAEIREIQIENISDEKQDIEVYAYFEPILTNAEDFAAHPAYSKLFIETSVCDSCLIVKRRSRSGDGDRYAGFCASAETAVICTSREKGLKRGGITAIERAIREGFPQFVGASVDPCVFMKTGVRVGSGEKRNVRFALCEAQNEADAVTTLKRALLATERDLSLRQDATAKMLGLSRKDITRAFQIYGKALFKDVDFSENDDQENHLGIEGLWPLGLSGELACVYFDASQPESEDMLMSILRQYLFLILNGAVLDFAILLNECGDYRRELRSSVMELLKLSACEGALERPGGIHFIDLMHVSDDQRRLLKKTSLNVKTLAQNEGVRSGLKLPILKKTGAGCKEASFRLSDKSASCDIRTGEGYVDIAFSHILANRAFGYLATDTGSGYMWYQNSRQNKIDRWINDPMAVCGPEEIFIMKGREKASVFSDGSACDITYSPGVAEYRKKIGELDVKTTFFVPGKLPMRIMMVECTGAGQESVELVLKISLQLSEKDTHSEGIKTWIDEETGALCAKNAFNTAFPDSIFAVFASEKLDSFTCDEQAYTSGRWNKKTGAFNAPCIALRVALQNEGDVGRAVIVTAAAGSAAAFAHYRHLADWEAACQELEKTRRYWHGLVMPLEIATCDKSLDRFMNGWALYQTTACRIFARTSMYQCGGAYGFRDQLQDVCALLYSAPESAKTHILRAAAHQFEEGDVQHWWHVEKAYGNTGNKGVRTKCSDDLLWLAYTVCEYIDKTGDENILNIPVPYIRSHPLAEEEHERYEIPQRSDVREPLYDHVLRAVDLVLRRGNGEHGLPLIGTGDWNDGFNRVGAGGRGESVWLSWFLAVVLERTSGMCGDRGDFERAKRYKDKAVEYTLAAENTFSGTQYLRGYYDDGAALGSETDAECSIDSVAQSFSAFCLGDEEKSRMAVKNAVDRLFDRENRIVRLFTPPFTDKTERNPGYIKGYLAGIRENGGQYTHAAVWLAVAALKRGYVDEGYEMLEALIPENHDQSVYKAEPYALCADVYANPQHVGRGGWSHYTGAAGWYYRAVFEELLGIRVIKGRELRIEPRLSKKLSGYEAVLRVCGEYRIKVTHGAPAAMEMDGKPVAGNVVVMDGGSHDIAVTI